MRKYLKIDKYLKKMLFKLKIPFLNNNTVKDENKKMPTLRNIRNEKNVRELKVKPNSSNVIRKNLYREHPNVKELKVKPKTTEYKNKFLVF